MPRERLREVEKLSRLAIYNCPTNTITFNFTLVCLCQACMNEVINVWPYCKKVIFLYFPNKIFCEIVDDDTVKNRYKIGEENVNGKKVTQENEQQVEENTNKPPLVICAKVHQGL